ncbi:hypothetical protein EJ994_13345 [Maribacter sp. MJ134]|uniref:abortive infection system antitoxin AbiGi family protein n=1 Tax=Maribacter sp. MJ134 TaxID=2496865 RepID=UPI000F827027|nr:abortive infection system antitoxin AbiGi family protein [Maribacter sp. MJ134]AZQ59734.1 hypothetical protein EJ994_13345 [Maribacter sp. MJ134]
MDYWVDTDRIFEPGERDSFPLIHMTQNWEILELILTEGLKPSYCKENITNNKENKGACFPMISTSNVDSDFAISYQKSYGTLGIILSKKWGEENDFNPVLYLERTSDLTNDIIGNFKDITTTSKDELENALNGVKIDHKSLLTKQQIKIFAHSKNYDGILVRNNTLMAEKYPYGMEREWRKIIQQEKVPYFLVGEDMDKKADFNELIKDLRVDFSIDHLLGVIVESDWQVERVKEIINKKFNLKEFPESIKIKINPARHVPDEG